ncbi:MAG: TraR/DksA C4-type zinc finger protein [Rhodobacteraceae bacterium]|nr:TraR/DksA C4-type zinc finger protein [Paracoccaceae bacterium]
MTTVADRKAQLEARRDDLNRRMQEIDAELDSHDSKDWEELATERETDEVLEDLGLSAQQELRMIDAALGRIEAGEYGFCVTCGAEISQERLDVVPATPFCRTCAARV